MNSAKKLKFRSSDCLSCKLCRAVIIMNLYYCIPSCLFSRGLCLSMLPIHRWCQPTNVCFHMWDILAINSSARCPHSSSSSTMFASILLTVHAAENTQVYSLALHSGHWQYVYFEKKSFGYRLLIIGPWKVINDYDQKKNSAICVWRSNFLN